MPVDPEMGIFHTQAVRPVMRLLILMIVLLSATCVMSCTRKGLQPEKMFASSDQDAPHDRLISLSGLGLVTNLAGTGDGDFGPARREVLHRRSATLENAGPNQVALVHCSIRFSESASFEPIPIDVVVMAIGPATSLANGNFEPQILRTPSDYVIRVDGGNVIVDPSMPTRGIVHSIMVLQVE